MQRQLVNRTDRREDVVFLGMFLLLAILNVRAAGREFQEKYTEACEAGVSNADHQRAGVAPSVSIDEEFKKTNDSQAESKLSLVFDGQTLAGWEGNTAVFRVQENSIVGGQLSASIPHNEFLSLEKEYSDFELLLEFRLIGEQTNAGIQLRSRRIPDHHEMIGYQADLGQDYWGCLYDESRRNRVLARPDADQLAKVLKKNDWNTYRIQCQGPRIQLWINDFQTVDYTEDDPAIEQHGRIALQIHGGPPGEAWYRNIRIRELK